MRLWIAVNNFYKKCSASCTDHSFCFIRPQCIFRNEGDYYYFYFLTQWQYPLTCIIWITKDQVSAKNLLFCSTEEKIQLRLEWPEGEKISRKHFILGWTIPSSCLLLSVEFQHWSHKQKNGSTFSIAVNSMSLSQKSLSQLMNNSERVSRMCLCVIV